MYDRLGLVKPRKVGKNRFYSDRDIERLQQIQHFTQDIGINLAGVAYIFALMDQMQQEETHVGPHGSDAAGGGRPRREIAHAQTKE